MSVLGRITRCLGPRVLGFVALMAAASVCGANQGAVFSSGNLGPTILKAPGHCVRPTEWMRHNHMKLLLQERTEWVREGIRDRKDSLENCVKCHAADAPNGAVFGAKQDFCVSCHRYAAVKITCFECHSATPKGKVPAFHPLYGPMGPHGEGANAHGLALMMRESASTGRLGLGASK